MKASRNLPALDLSNKARFDHDWGAGNLLIDAIMDTTLHLAENEPNRMFAFIH